MNAVRPAVVAALGVAMLALGGAALASRWRAARASATTARERLVVMQEEIREVQTLRRQRDTVQLAPSRPEDIVQIAREAMAEARVSASRLHSVTPEGERRMELGGLSSQSVRLHLSAVTSVELGRFLAAWRARTSVWRVESIEMSHARGSAHDAFGVRILLRADYRSADDGGGK